MSKSKIGTIDLHLGIKLLQIQRAIYPHFGRIYKEWVLMTNLLVLCLTYYTISRTKQSLKCNLKYLY